MRLERNDGASAGSRATTLRLCLLAGLAAMGAGTAASSQTPAPSQVPRSYGWRAASFGCGRRRRRVLQGDPLRGAPRRRPAVATAPTGGAVDGRAAGRGIRSGLHAGAVRPAPSPRCASGAGLVRGLPVPERLAPRERHDRGEAARDGLDSRGRIHGRLGRLAQHVGRPVRQAGRCARQRQLPPGALRLLRVPRIQPRAP